MSAFNAPATPLVFAETVARHAVPFATFLPPQAERSCNDCPDDPRLLPPALGLCLSASPATADQAGGTLQHPVRGRTPVPPRHAAAEKNRGGTQHHRLPALHPRACARLSRRPDSAAAAPADDAGGWRHGADRLVLYAHGRSEE